MRAGVMPSLAPSSHFPQLMVDFANNANNNYGGVDDGVDDGDNDGDGGDGGDAIVQVIALAANLGPPRLTPLQTCPWPEPSSNGTAGSFAKVKRNSFFLVLNCLFLPSDDS